MVDRPNLFLMINTLETGGSERQFAALARAICPEHFKIHLGCVRKFGSMANEFKNISEFPLGGSYFSWRALHSAIALARFLRGKKIKVAHSFDFYANLILLPIARLAGVPAVVGSHRQLGDLLTARQFRAQVIAFWFCDRVICNSQAAANRLSNYGVPTRKLIVIPNGLSSEAFARVAPILPPERGVVRVGMIGRMNVAYKNQAAFLRAAKQICARREQTEFILVGDGAFRSDFERLTQELDLGSRVRFWGEQSNMAAVLAALDLVVVPSISESMPNVILEAMAAGVPVIATRVGGIADVVEHERTGLLVPPGDDGRLVEAIEHLVREPSLRSEYGRRARESALRFQWPNVSGHFESVYSDLLST